jgi:hypothetical protein
VALLIPVFIERLDSARLPDTVRAIMDWLPSVGLATLVRMSFSDQVALDEILPPLASAPGNTLLVYVLVVWRLRQWDHSA